MKTPSTNLLAEPVDGMACRVCGFAGLRDTEDKMLNSTVTGLLGLPRDRFHQSLDGWASHWSRRYEFPFAFLAVVRHFGPTKSGASVEVLESGSGVTPVPIWLAQWGYSITCLDLDPGLAESWSSTEVAKKGLVRFQAGDMQALPFPDEAFDVGYSVSALEHTTDPRAAVRELLRVTRIGGLVIVTMDVALVGAHGIDALAFLDIQRMLGEQTSPIYPARWLTPDLLLTARKRARSGAGFMRGAIRELLDKFDASRRPDFGVWCFAGLRTGSGDPPR